MNEYGADSFRLYEMFMGPFDQSIPWDTKNIIGVKRFLDRVWKIQEKVIKRKENTELENLIHKTIKKISEDIENFHFNTSISSLMILLNEMEKQENISTEHYSLLVVLISPLAPHMAEELWMSVLNNKNQRILKNGQCLIRKNYKIKCSSSLSK